VLCFLHDSTPGGGSGSLRRDATNLTGDQQAFLQAVTELDAARAAKPAGDLADHSDRAHWWIQRTAVGMSQAETALGGDNWPDDAKDQVAMMITELQRDQPAWQAAGQDGSTSIDDLASQLAGQDPTLDESVARRALSLAAQPPAPVPTDPQPGTADPSPAVV
jgi:hypothetical protein